MSHSVSNIFELIQLESQKLSIFFNFITEQNRAKSSASLFEPSEFEQKFFEQFRVRAIFEQIFFEQFRVRVLSSGQIFERAEQNFERAAARSQH